MSYNMSSTITVNGITVQSSGNNISIRNGKVIVDGVDVTTNDKIINIVVNGNVDHIDGSFGDLSITGNVTGNIQTVSGDVRCSDVGGNIKTVSGDVNAGKIYGSVDTLSGDIST